VTLWRVAVRVPVDEGDIALARLIELVPEGLEEGTVGDEIEWVAYLDKKAANDLATAFPFAERSVVPEGWEDAWKEFHHSIVVGGIWIGPPWEASAAGMRTVVIDPGRAFGTGAHPTTRLCVELLARVEPGSLLDVGCGSGVLSLAAARLGFGPIVAVDNDPVAVDVTRANARANDVELDARLVDATAGDAANGGAITSGATTGDAAASDAITGEAMTAATTSEATIDAALPAVDVAVANVLLRPVEVVLSRLTARTVVSSGYLDGELPAHPGWVHVDRVEADGWAADRFERVGTALQSA
jgi:ribosomal protein L11 methyltransferase